MKMPRENDDNKISGEISVESTSGEDRLWTVKEAAHFLKLYPLSLYHLISERRLPVIRISSRCVRFSRRALEAWIAEKAVPARSSDSNQNIRMQSKFSKGETL
jgi:excisionase family DNA binding protein